jgi:uncharacterized protein (TIGR03086 family)
MNPTELFAEACSIAQRQVDAAVKTPHNQTGCAEWDATQLVNHLVVVLGMWADIATGQELQYDPFNPPHVLGDDMVSDFKAAARRAREAFAADGFMQQMFVTPAGEIPGAAMITFPTSDLYVHSWDLEQATGVAGDYPDELTALSMGFVQQAFADERPPHVVGPLVEVGGSASAHDLLLAFYGRPAVASV